MSERLTEFPDRRVWDLSGFTLDQICLDYRVTLLLAQPNSSVTVTIETSFILRASSRLEQIIPPQAVSSAPLLELLHEPITSLTAWRQGRLLLKFESGAEIEVPKDGLYETWQTYGQGETAGIGMLCSPHDGSPWGS